MKRIKKNQVIITALAIMIAVAGYINYAGNITDIISVSGRGSTGSVDTASESKDSEIQVPDEEPDDESMLEPGSVILTSGGVASGVISEAKLNREQIRAKNTENLTNIVNDANLDKSSKTAAVNELLLQAVFQLPFPLLIIQKRKWQLKYCLKQKVLMMLLPLYLIQA